MKIAILTLAYLKNSILANKWGILLFTQTILLIPKEKDQNAPAWLNSRTLYMQRDLSHI